MSHRQKVHSGLSLIEILIGISILGIAIAFFAGLLRKMGESSQTENTALNVQSTSTQVKDHLTRVLGGVSSSSRVKFRVAGVSTKGSGFIVLPNVDFSGAAAPSSNTLYLIKAEPAVTPLKLTASYPDTTLQIQSSDGTTPISQILSIGDFFIISSVNTADLLKVTLAPPAIPSGVLPLNDASFDYSILQTPSPPTLSTDYLPGDWVKKVRPLKIGLAPLSKMLKQANIDGSGESQIAKDIVRFRSGFRLASPCAGVDTANGNYSFDWTAINGEMKCYTKIDSLIFDFAISYVDKGIVSEKSFSHEIRLK